MEGMGIMEIGDFYRGKRVFITGHTGFKGSWLCKVLVDMGAKVTGYALEPPTEPNLFSLCGVEQNIHAILGDVRDLEHLQNIFAQVKPEIVFHLAAQPLVRESYQNPHTTYETNVMGTVNLLECIRTSGEAHLSVVNVTTDKVYLNREWVWGYRENEVLNGFDPYSNSKSCSDLITQCYRNSFFRNTKIAVSTVRAGNVIGGGDFSRDRIIPDCMRAVQAGESVLVRNPHSVRPYQHVLEPIFAYLLLAQKQYENCQYADSYNVGPEESDCITTEALVELFCKHWGKGTHWKVQPGKGPHEASFLTLDCSKMKAAFPWKPHWNIDLAVAKTVEWIKVYQSNMGIASCMEQQIQSYLEFI